MLRRTVTTLEALRIGDRFVYPKGNVAWEVTAKADKSGRVAVNQRGPDGRLIHRHDHLKRRGTRVTFLQHTVPVPQEVIFLENLQVGDVFAMKDDVVHEYELVKKGRDFYDVRRLDQSACIKGGRLADVIFLRHKADA